MSGGKKVSQMVEEARAFADAQPLTTRCALPGCNWSWEGPAAEGREMAAGHRRLQHRSVLDEPIQEPVRQDANGHSEVEGRAALDVMDQGEPQQPSEPPRQRAGRTRWTRDSVLAAIRAFAESHGRPPAITDTRGNPTLPSDATVKSLFGSWADGIEAAGFERPSRGSRYGPAKPKRTETIRDDPKRPEPAPTPLPVRRKPPPVADSEKVDTFELFDKLASAERIAYYEEAALQAQAKAEALRQIRAAVDSVRELEPT